MGKKPKTEYQVVCPNFGTQRHSTHVHTKKGMTLEEATAKAEGLDRHYQHLTKNDSDISYSYYRAEIGWKVETRMVTEWETVT